MDIRMVALPPGQSGDISVQHRAERNLNMADHDHTVPHQPSFAVENASRYLLLAPPTLRAHIGLSSRIDRRREAPVCFYRRRRTHRR